MAEKTIDAVGFGALNYDTVHTTDYPEPWDSIPEDFEGYRTQVRVSSSCEHSAGGSAANTIYGLGRLGLKTAFMGAIGQDAPGSHILESFGEVGVDIYPVVEKKGPSTGEACCFAFPGGERQIIISPGANSFYNDSDLEQALEETIAFSRLLHIASFIGDRQFNLQKELIGKVPSDTEISFSPGSLYVDRGYDEIEPMLVRSDYLFFNLDELLRLTDHPVECVDDAASSLLAALPRTQAIVLTLGSGFERPNTIDRGFRGLSLDVRTSMVFSRNQTIEVPAQSSANAFVDSVGAGDSYTAGFLFGRLTGRSLEESAYLGSRVASLCVSGKGAREMLPTRSQLETVSV